MKVYSVSQINGYIQNMFVKDMLLNRLSIKGEVSNCKYHTSGHIYFTLKDGTGQLACVMFAGQRTGLKFRLAEGQSVVVSGSIRVYERDGTYQMYAVQIEREGEGELYERLEQLKARLLAEGLFAPAHKKPIPSFAHKIGIVTARTGAALQDILTITARRNSYVTPILCPAQVQGEGAAQTIVSAIRRLDAFGVDVILVARGGGSIEDLWAFNEEMVARAVYECKTPIISGVGHETDVTLIDFVADLRAPTPSAAAELAVYEWRAFERELAERHSELTGAMLNRMERARMSLKQRSDRLELMSPSNRLNQYRQQVMHDEEKLSRVMHELLAKKRYELAAAAGRLKGLSPLERLSQGYSYVTDENGKPLKSVKTVEIGDELQVSVKDGTVLSRVTEIRS